MRILYARNVHDALPQGIRMIHQVGQPRDSRNGPVLVAPYPVVTVYERPLERVLFWPERDANPFFHLYESLWMLAGRNDVAGPARYAKNMANYSDDGETLHGAYGHRWRQHFIADFRPPITHDQLVTIANALRSNPDDRRCVLTMWDAQEDLGTNSKDIPCNLTATFQVDLGRRLNLVVFCRSNDIVWGAYGANAVHFSMLLEYMALWSGYEVGTYTQISVNWHAYLDTLQPLSALSYAMDKAGYIDNPYADGRVIPTRISGEIERVDEIIGDLLERADDGSIHEGSGPIEPWAHIWWLMLRAHDYYRTQVSEHRYTKALDVLDSYYEDNFSAVGHELDIHKSDWLVAGRQWLQRRYESWRELARA